MPLILAIEPDRRQAAHLTNIVRHRVGAELILSDTTERALASIGNRVPDLVLIPALLSPADDAALAAALRVIATAAHVQMLTIPVLGTARPKPRPRGGVLSALRRDRPEPSPDACDPAVFADQISSYLDRAAEERAAAHEMDEVAAPPAPAARRPVAPPFEIPPPDTSWMVPSPAAAEAPGFEEFLTDLERQAREIVKEAPIVAEAPKTVEQIVEPPDAGWGTEVLSAELQELEEALHSLSAPAPTPTPVEPVKPATAVAPDPPRERPVPPRERLAPPRERPAPPRERSVTPRERPVPPRDRPVPPRERPELFTLGAWRSWPKLEGMVAEPPKPFEAIELELPAPEPQAPEPAVAAEKPEWVELIESLRKDIERRRTEPPGPVQKPRVKRPRPIQDEWGFFDPEQCGFAALLAKLDEITDDDQLRR